MTAIPKALAMANPKQVVACAAAAAAGIITSKFGIDSIGSGTRPKDEDGVGIKLDTRYKR